jgi:hypothetical protein
LDIKITIPRWSFWLPKYFKQEVPSERRKHTRTAKDKIKQLIAKIRLWTTSLHRIMSFPLVQKIVEETATDHSLVINVHIPCMILSLEEKLLSYFSEQVSQDGDGQNPNPFLDRSVQLANLTTKMKENL